MGGETRRRRRKRAGCGRRTGNKRCGRKEVKGGGWETNKIKADTKDDRKKSQKEMLG